MSEYKIEASVDVFFGLLDDQFERLQDQEETEKDSYQNEINVYNNWTTLTEEKMNKFKDWATGCSSITDATQCNAKSSSSSAEGASCHWKTFWFSPSACLPDEQQWDMAINLLYNAVNGTPVSENFDDLVLPYQAFCVDLVSAITQGQTGKAVHGTIVNYGHPDIDSTLFYYLYKLYKELQTNKTDPVFIVKLMYKDASLAQTLVSLIVNANVSMQTRFQRIDDLFTIEAQDIVTKTATKVTKNAQGTKNNLLKLFLSSLLLQNLGTVEGQGNTAADNNNSVATTGRSVAKYIDPSMLPPDIEQYVPAKKPLNVVIERNLLGNTKNLELVTVRIQDIYENINNAETRYKQIYDALNNIVEIFKQLVSSQSRFKREIQASTEWSTGLLNSVNNIILYESYVQASTQYSYSFDTYVPAPDEWRTRQNQVLQMMNLQIPQVLSDPMVFQAFARMLYQSNLYAQDFFSSVILDNLSEGFNVLYNQSQDAEQKQAIAKAHVLFEFLSITAKQWQESQKLNKAEYLVDFPPELTKRTVTPLVKKYGLVTEEYGQYTNEEGYALKRAIEERGTKNALADAKIEIYNLTRTIVQHEINASKIELDAQAKGRKEATDTFITYQTLSILATLFSISGTALAAILKYCTSQSGESNNSKKEAIVTRATQEDKYQEPVQKTNITKTINNTITNYHVVQTPLVQPHNEDSFESLKKELDGELSKRGHRRGALRGIWVILMDYDPGEKPYLNIATINSRIINLVFATKHIGGGVVKKLPLKARDKPRDGIIEPILVENTQFTTAPGDETSLAYFVRNIMLRKENLIREQQQQR